MMISSHKMMTTCRLLFLSFCFCQALVGQIPERNSHLSLFNDRDLRFSIDKTLLHASIVLKSQSQRLIQQQSDLKIKIDSVVSVQKKQYFYYSTMRQQVVSLNYVYNVDAGCFQRVSRSEFNYDSFGNCSYEINTQYVFSGDKISDSIVSKSSYMYGINGPLNITVYGYYNGGWEYSNKSDFLYEGNRLTEVQNFRWNVNGWIAEDKCGYAYNDIGQLLSVVNLAWESSDWKFVEKSELDYDRSSRLSTITILTADTAGVNWELSQRNSLTYDTKGNVLSEEFERRDRVNNTWTLVDKAMYNYLDVNFKRGDIQNGDYVLGDFSSKHILNQVQYAGYDSVDKSWNMHPNDTKLYYSVLKLSAKQLLEDAGYKIFQQ